MLRAVVVAGLMLVAGGAMAADRKGNPDAGPSEFEAQLISIQEALDDGETYGDISSIERREVLAALARIRTALGPSGDAGQLNERQKLQVFNDQELINNILTSADEDSQLVCRREKKTGTHLASNQCLTVAERRRAADHARDMLLRTPPHALSR
ncbi:MAG: hypothetical protein L0H23_06890 [Luteimonas sp.]|nr:hypothetical protein [Luteimonas sp.]